jgi:hypothetical protein
MTTRLAKESIMKTFVLAAAIAAGLTATSAQAEQIRLKAGWPACTTREALKELINALIQGDAAWASGIPGCGSIKAGSTATLIDYGFLGVSEVYIHFGAGRPLRAFIENEAMG